MFYTPRAKETGLMWDTWLYWMNGTYYLFYLAKSGTGGRWDNMSLAESRDGVYWQEKGVIISKRPDAVWMGTGSTWISPDTNDRQKFYINYSEWRGDQQTIFFGESSNLEEWKHLGDQFEFKPDPRWYNVEQGTSSRWDCIFTTPRDDGGLWGYWTASPTAHHGVGFGRTEDGITWEALKPPVIDPPLESSCEHGAVARVGEIYYHMLGIEGGMYTYIAQSPGGPLHRAEKNYALLTCGNDLKPGLRYTYFARFFHAPGGLMVNHHSIGPDGRVFLGLLKRAVFDSDGTFRLGWWEGNDILKRQAIELVCPVSKKSSEIRMIPNTFDPELGFILESNAKIPAGDQGSTGLYIETDGGKGIGILVGKEGVTEIGIFDPDVSLFHLESRTDRQFNFGEVACIRLVLKGDLLELYLEDVLMQCYSLGATSTGRMGILGDVTDLSAWEF